MLDLWWWFFITRTLEGDRTLSLLAPLAAIAGHLMRQTLNLQACPNGGLLISLVLLTGTMHTAPPYIVISFIAYEGSRLAHVIIRTDNT